jgi:hypothetical protein
MHLSSIRTTPQFLKENGFFIKIRGHNLCPEITQFGAENIPSLI